MVDRKLQKRRGRGAEPEVTRNTLLAAATTLFAQQGYEGTRVEQIARRAGVNKAMISYHFGGKEKLYTAVLSAKVREVAARVRDVAESQQPADAVLREYIRTFGEFLSANPETPPILVREMLSGGLRLDAEVLPHFLTVLTVVREIVERGIREGAFRPVHPFLTHMSVVGALVFFFLTRPFRERLSAAGRVPFVLPTPDEFLRHMQDMVARGLSAGPTEAS